MFLPKHDLDDHEANSASVNLAELKAQTDAQASSRFSQNILSIPDNIATIIKRAKELVDILSQTWRHFYVVFLNQVLELPGHIPKVSTKVCQKQQSYCHVMSNKPHLNLSTSRSLSNYDSGQLSSTTLIQREGNWAKGII